MNSISIRHEHYEMAADTVDSHTRGLKDGEGDGDGDW